MHWALRQFNNQLGSDTQVGVGQQNWQNFLSFFNCVPNPIVHTCMKWQQIELYMCNLVSYRKFKCPMFLYVRDVILALTLKLINFREEKLWTSVLLVYWVEQGDEAYYFKAQAWKLPCKNTFALLYITFKTGNPKFIKKNSVHPLFHPISVHNFLNQSFSTKISPN